MILRPPHLKEWPFDSMVARGQMVLMAYGADNCLDIRDGVLTNEH